MLKIAADVDSEESESGRLFTLPLQERTHGAGQAGEGGGAGTREPLVAPLSVFVRLKRTQGRRTGRGEIWVVGEVAFLL